MTLPYYVILGIGLYSLIMIIVGSVEMTRAKKNLDEASQFAITQGERTIKYQADYNKKKEELDFAEDAIPSSKCYKENYGVFVNELNSFCSGNKLTFYNLEIVFKDTSVKNEIRTDSELVCTLIPVTTCSTRNKVTRCNTNFICAYHRVYFNIIKEITSVYGYTINGMGRNVELTCGRFSQAINITSDQFLQSSTFIKIDKYLEKQVDTYSSKATIKTQNNTQIDLKELKYDANILSEIKASCSFLKSDLKHPSFYEKIANDTLQVLPSLRFLEEQARMALETQKELNKNAADQTSNSNDAYNASLTLWLLLILLSPFLIVGAAFLFYNEEEIAKSFRLRKDANVPVAEEVSEAKSEEKREEKEDNKNIIMV